MRYLVLVLALLAACVNGPLLPAPSSPAASPLTIASPVSHPDPRACESHNMMPTVDCGDGSMAYDGCRWHCEDPGFVVDDPQPQQRPSHAALGGLPGGGFIPPTRISIGGGGGTITSVVAGNGLTGGGSSGSVTLDVGAGNGISVGTDSIAVLNGAGLIFSGSNLTYDPTVIQSRITGTCGAGNAIASVNSDGTVTCQAVGSGTVTGPGTTGDLPIWTGPTALGSFAGSSPAACPASQAMVSAALSAAGVLTTTCTGIVPSVSTTAPLTGGGSGAVSLGLSFSSNFHTSGSALDLNTAVTMPGSITTKKTIGTPDAQTLASGAVTLTPGANATIERLTCDGVSGTQINTMAAGTDGQQLDIEAVSGFCEFNASGSSTTIETPNNQVVFLNGGANGDDGARATYDSTLGKWAITSAAKITGVVAGTGLTNPTGNSSGIVTLAANLAGAACAAGTAVTSISSAGAGSCSAFVTSSSLTTNHLTKATGAGAIGDSNIVDDGTTATLGTSKVTVNESTGGILDNTSGTPTDSQIRLQGTTRSPSGTMALNVDDRDTMELYFDAERVGGTLIATTNTVAYIAKISGYLNINGAMSATAGSAFTAVNYDQLTLSTGFWEHKYDEKIDGNTTLGNAGTKTTTINGHLLGGDTTPTLSSCGTSTLETGSTDMLWTIDWDASSTACTITFSGTAYMHYPDCGLTFVDLNSKGNVPQWIHSRTSTSLTIYQSSASNGAVTGVCGGH